MPPPADPTDADALRVLGDQLEEQGDDAGAALLRDVAGRIERSIRLVGPAVKWSGDLLVRRIRWYGGLPGRPFDYRDHVSVSIEAEPVGIWLLHEVKR